MSGPVARARNLSKRFREKVAVEALDVEMHPGEIVGLLGPNGSGKTTTIKLMLGLLRPSTGTVELFGRPVDGGPGDHAANVGAMVEAPALYPWMSGRDNLRVLARMARLGDSAVDAALELSGLGEAAHRKAGNYSVGMKQRLGLAIALLGEPSLVILDEPTIGLDPGGQRDIESLLRKLRNEGRTVLLSSHQLGEVERICDRVIILREGRKAFEGGRDSLPAARHSFQVRVDDANRAAAALRALPSVASVAIAGSGPDALIVEAQPGDAGAITAALVNAGVSVEEFRPVEASLEALFFDLTGRRDAA
ncbi:MAG: ABC transporter ATP-binding protein [Dehalococcoidia bacterium]